jgi:hypothetical protein
VKSGDAYTAYKAWCLEMGKEGVSLTAFGTTMKGEFGVLYEEKSKRGFYLDIALVGRAEAGRQSHRQGNARRALGDMVSSAHNQSPRLEVTYMHELGRNAGS